MNRLIFNIIAILIFTCINAFAINSSADCIIIKDDNSIICKYKHERRDIEKIVKFEWHDPSGNISRKRDIIIPAGHGSIYDYRYLDGRLPGEWTFKVFDNNHTIESKFVIE
jgi:hypothetical protein